MRLRAKIRINLKRKKKMELKGKSIAFLGDSITAGGGVADKDKYRYDNYMKEIYGLSEVYNYGIGGTRLAYQRVPSDEAMYDLYFCGRAYFINREADIVLVYGGINDYLHGDAPIGNRGDKTPATFYGAVYYLMDYLKREFAGKPIVFLSPARIFFDGMDGSEPSTDARKGEGALSLLGYKRIIKETADIFNIPVLDLYDSLGIDPKIPSDKEKYTVDGLHFNDEGHKKIAKTVGDFLMAL